LIATPARETRSSRRRRTSDGDVDFPASGCAASRIERCQETPPTGPRIFTEVSPGSATRPWTPGGEPPRGKEATVTARNGLAAMPPEDLVARASVRWTGWRGDSQLRAGVTRAVIHLPRTVPQDPGSSVERAETGVHREGEIPPPSSRRKIRAAASRPPGEIPDLRGDVSGRSTPREDPGHRQREPNWQRALLPRPGVRANESYVPSVGWRTSRVSRSRRRERS